jgi:hypothetical protein
MSNVDLADKAIYDMLNDNQKVVVPEQLTQDEMTQDEMTQDEMTQQVESVQPVQAKQPSKKMVRSLKGFVMFALIVVLIAAFIYFTIYRLGWGVSECMKKNYHNCATLLTPEVAPLAATGLLALL